MHRALILSALAAMPLPLWADDIYTPAPVISAILYPDGAVQTHQITVDLPAGQHRILVPAASFQNSNGLPDLSLRSGTAKFGGITLLENMPTTDPALLTPAQVQATAVFEEAKAAVKVQQDEVARISDSIAALKTELTFLENISPPNDKATIEELKSVASLVGTETLDVRKRMASQQQALRSATQQLAELETKQNEAKNALDRLSPPADTGTLFAVSVSVSEAQNLVLEARSSFWEGSWVPFYDLRLAEPEQRSLTIERSVAVHPPRGAVWDQIDLTLSTQRPSEQVKPSDRIGNQASIHQPRPAPSPATRSLKSADMAEIMESAAFEPELMMDEASGMTVDTGGIAVTYRAPTKVTAAGGDMQILEMGHLSLPVTPEIYAVPRRDNTAFLVAQLINDTAEPLLGGDAKIYRGDTLIGHSAMPFLAAGDRTTLPFGPIEGIRLEHVVAENETGDRGIISTTNTRDQDTVFRVENLTDVAHEVKAFYPLTYSEQEDLEVEISATPRPDERDHDDIRGLAVWNLSLAPGEKAEVMINTRLSWPDGWQLNWRP